MKEGDHKKTAGREIICYSSTQSKGKSQQNSTHTKSNMTIHMIISWGSQTLVEERCSHCISN